MKRPRKYDHKMSQTIVELIDFVIEIFGKALDMCKFPSYQIRD